jgi:hypothetical protein
MSFGVRKRVRRDMFMDGKWDIASCEELKDCFVCFVQAICP